MKVYLAGPDVFLDDAVAFGARKVALCARFGLRGLFPLDNPVDVVAQNPARQIFLANQRMMDEADAIVANLTPFRGPSADVGTVYELGYMIGLGRRAVAYCNDPSLYADKVACMTAVQNTAKGEMRDANGLLIEDFGGIDNLMITESLGSRDCATIVAKTRPADPMRDLAGFERCLQILTGAAPR